MVMFCDVTAKHSSPNYCCSFSHQIFFLLAMATKMVLVTTWSVDSPWVFSSFFLHSSFHLSFHPHFLFLALKWQDPRTLFLSGFQEDDTGLLSKSKVTPPPKKATVEAKPPPATQPSKPKSGGGLFSDEDEEEGGGLFGAPAVKPQLPQVETKSKPKPKTTISLFDDDEQDEEDEDFFSASASTKANRYHLNVFNFYVAKCNLLGEVKNETMPARQQSLGHL